MSDSTENTNELDSYGVWVKNTNEEGGAEDDLNFADSLDLPDFEETDNIEDGDFSDMFKEDDTLNLDSMSDDTTLTDDELMNITSGDGIQLEETSADESLDEVDFNSEIGDGLDTEQSSLDDISFDSLEENSVSDADLSSFEDTVIEEPSASEETAQEPVESDFELDDIPDDVAAVEESTVEEPVIEESEAPVVESAEDTSVEEMNIEDFGVESSSGGEEEISLDDFMDSPSESSGFTADAAPSASDSEEVSLDDFVDMSEFGMEEEAPKKEETITDEKPLDMDISFDSSAETIATEENSDSDSDLLDDDDLAEEETVQTDTATEEVDVSAFGNDIESEEVDLSDFGIDADAEETPVTQDVEGEKNKEAVVDYDLSVGDSNMNAAPVVNEIKAGIIEDAAEVEEIPEEITPAAQPSTSNVDNSLLQQIVADLSNLKEEINTLKNNLEEMKAAPAPAASESQGIISEEIAVDEPVIEEDSSKEDTGFFSGDDGDDTIALSTDELSNILNTADFSENSEEAAVTDDITEESVAEEPVVEEPAIEEETFVEEPAVEETIEETVTEEPSADSFEDETLGEEISDEALGAIEDTPSDIKFDFEEENLSEPNLDDIELDEEVLEDDLPDEIEISKDDDILVESSSSDFMDSVQDTTDEHQPEEGVVEEIEDETIEPQEEFKIEDESFSTVDNLFDQPEISEIENIVADEAPAAEEVVVEEEPVVADEPVVEEETIIEEPVTEEAASEEIVEEPVVEEEPVIEDETFVEEPLVDTAAADIENDFVSHEDDNNDLTDSNIDYLTTEEKQPEETVDENAELKKDIKSVLLYMDQLLENLPEEKIVEFAKSDEFTTYKKLFSELGLS